MLQDSFRQNVRVYGPYKRKDGREHVCLLFDNGKKQTVSYPKWLMEQKLGRELDPDRETIDHKDMDPLNNNWDNLEIKERSKHISEDHLRVKPFNLVCIWCNKDFTTPNRPRDRIRNKKIGKAGPFCSKTCSGEYGASKQRGEINKLTYSDLPNIEYYRQKEKINE